MGRLSGLSLMLLALAGMAWAGEQASTVVPHDSEHWEVFKLLRGRGLRVAVLGERERLLIPPELRFKEVEATELVRATAAFNGFKAEWPEGRGAAILYREVEPRFVDALLVDLRSGEAAVRRTAAKRAGRMGTPRIVSALLAVARDPDKSICLAARRSLGEIGWDAALILDEETALKILAEEIREEGHDRRSSLVAALGRGGTEASLALAEKSLGDKSEMVAGAALESLGLIGGEKAAGLIEKYMADPKLEWNACRGALYMGGERGVGLIKRALAGPNGGVKLFFLSRAVGDGAMPAISAGLSSSDRRVRLKAVEALGYVQSADALAALSRALADQDEICRNVAISALGHYGGDRAAELLGGVALAPGDKKGSQAGVELGRIGSGRALDILRRGLESSDPAVRGNACAGIPHVGGAPGVELAVKVLKAGGKSGGEDELRVLARYGGDEVLPLFKEIVTKADNDHHDYRAAAAVAMLGEMGRPEALPILKYAAGRWNMKQAAIEALGRIGDDGASEVLNGMLASRDDSTREAASRALELRGAPRLKAEKAGGQPLPPEPEAVPAPKPPQPKDPGKKPDEEDF